MVKQSVLPGYGHDLKAQTFHPSLKDDLSLPAASLKHSKPMHEIVQAGPLKHRCSKHSQLVMVPTAHSQVPSVGDVLGSILIWHYTVRKLLISCFPLVVVKLNCVNLIGLGVTEWISKPHFWVHLGGS